MKELTVAGALAIRFLAVSNHSEAGLQEPSLLRCKGPTKYSSKVQSMSRLPPWPLFLCLVRFEAWAIITCAEKFQIEGGRGGCQFPGRAKETDVRVTS